MDLSKRRHETVAMDLSKGRQEIVTMDLRNGRQKNSNNGSEQG